MVIRYPSHLTAIAIFIFIPGHQSHLRQAGFVPLGWLRDPPILTSSDGWKEYKLGFRKDRARAWTFVVLTTRLRKWCVSPRAEHFIWICAYNFLWIDMERLTFSLARLSTLVGGLPLWKLLNSYILFVYYQTTIKWLQNWWNERTFCSAHLGGLTEPLVGIHKQLYFKDIGDMRQFTDTFSLTVRKTDWHKHPMDWHHANANFILLNRATLPSVELKEISITT
jgi:hypothetical protein